MIMIMIIINNYILGLLKKYDATLVSDNSEPA